MTSSHQEDAICLTESLDKLEIDMLAGLVAGSSLRQIASSMGMEVAEADALKQALMRKLNAGTTADLVRFGICSQSD